MAQHAHQPLPRLALLLAQRAAAGRPAPPAGAAARPAGRCCAAARRGRAPRRRCASSVRGAVALQQLREPQRRRASVPEQLRSAAGPSSRSPRAVDQPQRARRRRRRTPRRRSPPSPARSSAVASSAPSRCSRSVSPSALTSSSATPSASSRAGAAGADRVVALAQRGQQVGEGLQRPDDPLAQRRQRQPDQPGADAREGPAAPWRGGVAAVQSSASGGRPASPPASARRGRRADRGVGTRGALTGSLEAVLLQPPVERAAATARAPSPRRSRCRPCAPGRAG